MNADPKETLSIAITGVLTIQRADLEEILGRLLPVRLTSLTPDASVRSPEGGGSPTRLGYTVKQTAELLGVGYATIYRLLKRGLLRSSSALRTKVIPKTEIDRFLKETTRSSW
jgi:excisionase family DNA binding protein